MATRAASKSASSKALLPLLKSNDSGFEEAFERFVHRREEEAEDALSVVEEIIARVREEGDDAVLDLTKQFDGADLEILEVTRDEWDAGVDLVDAADRAALGKAAMRVREFHRKRIPSSWEMREEGGGTFGHRVRPLERVGVYLPGGKAGYPSTVIMNAVPASVVEVPEIVLATPANPDGSVNPEVLLAARVAGVHRVFKVGGAQAIAALAIGTQQIPRVDKIVGPGDDHVATAKRLLFGEVAIASESGPTEVVIIADKSATPAWVAADMISQAEHDERASAILITTQKAISTRVQEQIAKQLKGLDRESIAKKSLTGRGAVIIAKDITEAIALSDRIAPEHLVLALDDADVQQHGLVDTGQRDIKLGFLSDNEFLDCTARCAQCEQGQQDCSASHYYWVPYFSPLYLRYSSQRRSRSSGSSSAKAASRSCRATTSSNASGWMSSGVRA